MNASIQKHAYVIKHGEKLEGNIEKIKIALWQQ